MQNKLRSLDGDSRMLHTINLNSQHTGPSLQAVLESPLEKKAGGAEVASLLLCHGFLFCFCYQFACHRNAFWPPGNEETNILRR